MRLLHLIVVAALVTAAAWVYKIKFESARQAERVATLGTDLRRERDAVASLRAEWSRLDNPARIQGLAVRHLSLKAIEATQFDTLDHLPERSVPATASETYDPIGTMIDMGAPDYPTGSVNAPAAAR